MMVSRRLNVHHVSHLFNGSVSQCVGVGSTSSVSVAQRGHYGFRILFFYSGMIKCFMKLKNPPPRRPAPAPLPVPPGPAPPAPTTNATRCCGARGGARARGGL